MIDRLNVILLRGEDFLREECRRTEENVLQRGEDTLLTGKGSLRKEEGTLQKEEEFLRRGNEYLRRGNEFRRRGGDILQIDVEIHQIEDEIHRKDEGVPLREDGILPSEEGYHQRKGKEKIPLPIGRILRREGGDPLTDQTVKNHRITNPILRIGKRNLLHEDVVQGLLREVAVPGVKTVINFTHSSVNFKISIILHLGRPYRVLVTNFRLGKV